MPSPSRYYSSTAAKTTLSGAIDAVLPRGTYVEFDSSDYLGETYSMDTERVDVQENTQEELA